MPDTKQIYRLHHGGDYLEIETLTGMVLTANYPDDEDHALAVKIVEILNKTLA